MHPYENADSYLGQQSRDADEVITSAPPIPGIPAAWDAEETWTGEEPAPDAPPCESAGPELCAPRADRMVELEDALVGARARAALQERRAENAEAALAAERGRASACASGGLRGVRTDDLLFEVNRRFFEGFAAVFSRPVATAAVPVPRDDARDDARQDAS